MKTISPADAELVKAYLRLIEAGFDSNGNVDSFYFRGSRISAIPSYTLAQFQAGGFDLTVARHVLISDVYSDTDSSPSLWYIAPTASTQKRKLRDKYVVYSTLALLVADFPAASYPGLCALITGLNNVVVRSNGTRYVPINGQATLFQDNFGTLAAPALTEGAGSTTFTFNIGAPQIPANLLAIDDKLYVRARFQRHNANATMNTIKICIGTAGTTSDAYVWSATLAATDLLQASAFCYADIVTATAFVTNSTSTLTGTGGTTNLVDQTTNFNIASAMTITIGGTKHTSDTLDLISYQVVWEAD